MILVDTSVWIDHFRNGDPQLAALLHEGKVLMHPFVIGELACGNLKDCRQILQLLEALPSIPKTSNREAIFFIEQRSLMGRGIGFIDAHLLASVALQGTAPLWTRDQRLKKVARELGLAWERDS